MNIPLCIFHCYSQVATDSKGAQFGFTIDKRQGIRNQRMQGCSIKFALPENFPGMTLL